MGEQHDQQVQQAAQTALSDIAGIHKRAVDALWPHEPTPSARHPLAEHDTHRHVLRNHQ